MKMFQVEKERMWETWKNYVKLACKVNKVTVSLNVIFLYINLILSNFTVKCMAVE